VWIRRPNAPAPHPEVAAPDKTFAEEEYRWFSLSTLYLLEHLPVRCINPYSASRAINNKAVQLHLAAKNGLKIPETVMTNAPAAVRESFRDCDRGKVCKAFSPHIWKKEGSGALAVTETFEISAEALPEDEVLTYAPAIYQEKIVKVFDVRMVVLGTTVYSYSLHTPNRALDWRQEVAQGHVGLEEIATPADVETAVLEFSREAGIEFGSFDFAVDPDGAWWFLEVNEEGQFLWLDEFNPALRVQEKFLAFLTLPKGASRKEKRLSVLERLLRYSFESGGPRGSRFGRPGSLCGTVARQRKNAPRFSRGFRGESKQRRTFFRPLFFRLLRGASGWCAGSGDTSARCPRFSSAADC
jgi:glutathione synthase/RimK-type ligase-like ATP-grasp enzyme